MRTIQSSNPRKKSCQDTSQRVTRDYGRSSYFRLAFRRIVCLAGVVLLCLVGDTCTAQTTELPADPLSAAPAWKPVDPDEVRNTALAWLREQEPGEAIMAQADELWSQVPAQPDGTQLLDTLAVTFALADPNAAALVEICSGPNSQLLLPSQPWLTDPQTPPLLANNMRLFYGRWLVHQTLYDEALDQLTDLQPGDVVAPASLLFYRAVVHHRLLDKEAGLEAIDQLLTDAASSPQRYVDVASLMQQDLTGLEPETLDHIARRMDDIRRRLALGRAGQRVREVEDGVIESLDKLIEELEAQQQQQQQSSSSSSGESIRSAAPAPDSALIGGHAPGNAGRRPIGSDSGWGDLPPKEREEVLQQIGREFPAHYRDVIEQYFRRLAAEGSQ